VGPKVGAWAFSRSDHPLQASTMLRQPTQESQTSTSNQSLRATKTPPKPPAPNHAPQRTHLLLGRPGHLEHAAALEADARQRGELLGGEAPAVPQRAQGRLGPSAARVLLGEAPVIVGEVGLRLLEWGGWWERVRGGGRRCSRWVGRA